MRILERIKIKINKIIPITMMITIQIIPMKDRNKIILKIMKINLEIIIIVIQMIHQITQVIM